MLQPGLCDLVSHYIFILIIHTYIFGISLLNLYSWQWNKELSYFIHCNALWKFKKLKISAQSRSREVLGFWFFFFSWKYYKTIWGVHVLTCSHFQVTNKLQFKEKPTYAVNHFVLHGILNICVYAPNYLSLRFLDTLILRKYPWKSCWKLIAWLPVQKLVMGKNGT